MKVTQIALLVLSLSQIALGSPQKLDLTAGMYCHSVDREPVFRMQMWVSPFQNGMAVVALKHPDSQNIRKFKLDTIVAQAGESDPYSSLKGDKAEIIVDNWNYDSEFAGYIAWINIDGDQERYNFVCRNR